MLLATCDSKKPSFDAFVERLMKEGRCDSSSVELLEKTYEPLRAPGSGYPKFLEAWPSWRQCACFGAGLHPCPSLGAALGAAETIVVPVFTVKTPGDDSVAVNEAVEHNALWDEMTAREGREAARRAGMKTGDWQAERQLQEALRESRREVGNAGLAAGGDEETGEEKSFVDVGFHAFATEAVEGGGDNMSEHERGMSIGENVGGSEAREEGERRVGRQDEQAAEKEEELEQEMEDEAEGFGGVELMVTDNADVEAIPTVRGDGRHSPTKGVSGSRRGAARCRLEEGGWEESKMELVDDREARKVSKVARGKGGSSRPGGDGGRRKCVSSKEGTREGRRLKGVSAGELGGAAARDVGAGVDKKQDERQRVEQGEVKDGDGDGERLDDDEDGDAVAEPLPPDIMLTLNDDSLHRIMLFLHPEDAIECRVVSSRWEFPSHEAVFEGLCRRTYLAQSAKKLLNVKRWRTWQRMFRLRPRLRDTGLYSLKTTYYKKPVRDMSTSWTPGQILEVTYYRYFRFFGDGRVAYGLTHESPKEFVRLLQEDSPKVYYGTYTINKAEVKVEMPTSWSHVYFTLQLTSGERGRFTHLVMERHSSIPRNDPRAGLCNHPVKSSDVFTFRRVLQF